MKEIRGRPVYLREDTTDLPTWVDVCKGYHLPPDDWPAPCTVLDIGCNCGLTLVDYALKWPEAKVIGYELDRANCFAARKNAAGLAQVFHCAVSTYEGIATYDPEANGEWGYRLSSDGHVVVPVTTLDSIYDSLFPCEDIDFLKLDIEGEEKPVLEHALAAEAHWPSQTRSLYVELHRWDMTEAISLLRELGFDQVFVSEQIEWGLFARRMN